jgi:hypothetical protein
MATRAQDNINIVPLPAEVKLGKGDFKITRNTHIILEGNGLEKSAEFLK